MGLSIIDQQVHIYESLENTNNIWFVIYFESWKIDIFYREPHCLHVNLKHRSLVLIW